MDEIAKENLHVKILTEKLEQAQKELEEKDKQLEHYKQLVKTLNAALAEATKNAVSNSGISHSTSSGNLSSQAGGNKSGKSEGGRERKGSMTKSRSRSRSFTSDSYEDAIGSHLLSDDEEGEHSANHGNNNVSHTVNANSVTSATSHNNSNNNTVAPASSTAPNSSISSATASIFGFAAPKEENHAKKGQDHVDVNKIASWRRPSVELANPNSSASNNNNSSSTRTTVTQPKSVTINANAITNSPRGLKKSVSHHSISDIQKDKDNAHRNPFGDMLGNRPSAPLRGTVGGKREQLPTSTSNNNLAASAIPSQKKVEEEPKGNKLKKSQSMTAVYSVLEENRLDLKFPELDQMVGQIYALSKYQQGCRFLQKKLDENNDHNTQIILNELLDHLLELMTDPFGNYLFSKLMEHCTPSQKESIVQKILTDLLPTAFDMYGTQSMQKMMPYLTENQIESVVNALKPSSIALIKHNKANYLVQYCLDHLPQKHNQWIYDAVAECMDDVGRDRVGCVIVKRCIDHATPEQMHNLFAEICNKALALVQDPFGNYVVQHVLEKFPESEQAQTLIERLLGNITDLCVQKFSSNVVEKCLQLSNPQNRHHLLTEMTNSDMLPQLLNDRFANFVIQTALDVANPEDRAALVKNIIPHLGRHYSPYTKRLQKKILQV
eukprot:TRINITY_DN403_c0_g1_i3.p1 TRINITY_DN403_c0_g1~~TRINITY_DN403_c0_g1_i3.p1  ORF type:complete len:665 (-),score=322.91 TRINITY_DN403_c0_g1_i3:293-2287(-)